MLNAQRKKEEKSSRIILLIRRLSPRPSRAFAFALSNVDIARRGACKGSTAHGTLCLGDDA
ncbi:hypothetical protein AWENTII_011345 [Aspergillus wentii]